MSTDEDRPEEGSPHFVRELIAADVAAGKHGGRVQTRFPPEPNGYLHIGHAKAIWIDFGMAQEFEGKCNLRFDDTNPVAEDVEFVEAIQRDIRWLGFEWTPPVHYASDYFETMYACAVHLIEQGKAYVDSQNLDEIRARRGNFYKPGEDSPYRGRSVEENLDLFARMRAGEFEAGEHVLRAKIDMQHKNLNMRDPLLYRIIEQHHHRTGDAWCIYPMYDYAHPLGDAIEDVTHSLCSLEFQDHRPLYDWVVANCPVEGKPEQTEFARLNLGYTVMSKRKLRQLVEDGHVDGWDDPRMPTLSGMRRAGVPPEALLAFCERVGVSKRDGVVDLSLFEHAVRERLNEVAPRYMGVLRPLKVTITNYPEGEDEIFDARLHPEDEGYGTRALPFCRELYIERDDFREDAPRKWFRLAPGKEVRLRYACLLTCDEVIKDAAGEVVELRCTWDPESRGGRSPDGRKVKGTLHWVSARHAKPASVRLYDRLFAAENPMEGDGEDGKSFLDHLNPNSLERVEGAMLEPALAALGAGESFQLERLGYFCVDSDSAPGEMVLNRTIGLRDSWAKLAKKLGA
ncbi:glutamine--tRNA ligase/YqeY domain fusion protein [Pseudenhygromyxa sp. WMMC2535]|uniref:glutamine--tRNA ligase/YqeY domain fusion protein n=1 Tax=Pseudenhygromyxa sp. WMMC2535 TaxID=2712867 RepID=UPI001556C0AD|nr:glutamine--tRNA ligase/YqeY domain fusion protein [Pseudenhygromyxa sp. WMMC2535]NVB40277.1 glutamine--tRNA ligase/YqeY domain fusion protein [Pseudenhygromyxa sp. WMMC2535]